MPTADLESEAFVTQLTKNLIDIYGGAKDEIMALLAKSSLTGFQRDRLEALERQVRAIVGKLDVAAADFAANGIPKSYKAGQSIAREALTEIGVKKMPDWGARVHIDAVDVIARQMATDALERNASINSNVSRALQQTKQIALTETQINRQIAQGLIEGETRKQTSKRISERLIDELGQGKLLTAGSRQFTPEEYAELLARTRTREAVTHGIVNSAADIGFDLFHVSVHENPCPVCRPYQGRVFSLSGESKTFPKLDVRPPFHPRCKHVLVPVSEEHLERKGLLDATVKLSNDPSIQVSNHADYTRFLESNPQQPKRRDLPPPPAPDPPKPLTVDAIPRGADGAQAFGRRLTAKADAKPLGGSTGARLFQDDEGTQWVVKGYGGNELQAQNEYLANRLYEMNGVSVPAARLATVEGKTAVALQYIEDRGAVVAGTANKAALRDLAGFKKGFVTDAFVANWDVIGLEYDNVMLVPGKASKVWRLDQGGSLLFRAQGSPKGAAFGGKVNELHTLRDTTKNPQSANVFATLTDDDILKQLTALLKNVDADSIAAAISDAGIAGETAKSLQTTLGARLDDLRAAKKDLAARKKKLALRAKAGSNAPGARRTHAHTKTATSSLELDQLFSSKQRLVPEQFSALRDFTGSSFKTMNRAAWKSGTGNAALDDLLWGDDLPGYVGYSQRKIGSVPNREAMMKKWSSGEWTEAWWSAYSSSSIVPGGTYGSNFRGFNFIVSNKGRQGSYVGNYSRVEHEKELLYGRNSAFRVVGWDIDEDEYYVFLEEVDGDIPAAQGPPPRINSASFLEAWRREYHIANADTSQLRLEDFKK